MDIVTGQTVRSVFVEVKERNANWSRDEQTFIIMQRKLWNHFQSEKRCSKNKNQTEIWKKPEMIGKKVSGFIIVWKNFVSVHTIIKSLRVDRTAAEWKNVACATRRRRRACEKTRNHFLHALLD